MAPDAASPFVDLQEFPRGLDKWAVDACVEIDLDALGSLIVSRCVRVFDSTVADQQFSEYLGLSVLENLDILVRLISDGIDPSQLKLEQPLSFASIQAQLRVPQADLQRSYRVSFGTIWDHMTDIVDQRGREIGIPGESLARNIRSLTRIIFSYHDYVTSRAATNYTRVEATLGQSRARLRQQLVQEMIRDGVEALSASELAMLDIDFSGEHLAIVMPDSSIDDGERLVRHCRAAGLVGQGLVHPRGLGSTAVWLTRHHSWDEVGLSAVQRGISQMELSAVIGEPHRGPGGFIDSLREAEEAVPLLTALTESESPVLIRYSTVMLDLLLMRDPEKASAYVSRTLGPLADRGPEATRLCSTLEAWLRSGSYVAAADALGVHEQTIRNRLTRAEALVGSGLRYRRTEVEVALRLRRLLGPQPFGTSAKH